MKRSLLASILIAAIVLLFSVPVFADLTVEQIVDKSLNREAGKNKIADMEMVIQRGSSKKVRAFTSWQLETPNGSKKLLRFTSPAQMKGTAFLSWENKDRDDDQWLYLSSRRQVRRIASSDKSSFFLGSDLTYEDMGEWQVSDRAHKMLEETKLDGRDVWVVESTLKPGKESGYKKAISYIDKETFIALKLETYDDKGKLIKIMYAKKYEKINDVWTVMELQVVPENGKTSTSMIVKKIEYGMDIPASKFKKEALKKF